MINWDDYKNFSKWEFDCKHTGENKMQVEFMAVLQQIRNVWGKPLVITSGFRHWTHPEEKEKDYRGEHTLGLAADIKMRGLTNVLDFCKIAELHSIKRIGIYQNRKKGHFIHLGMGDKAHKFEPALWTE